MLPPESITIGAVEKAVKLPVKKWHGNCYSIACKIVAAKLVKGRAVYGHYHGPIAATGYWASKRGNHIVRHGWIVLADGRILDPTRWSFEDKKPYLAIFEPDDEIVCATCGHVDEEHGRGLFRACQVCPEDECPDFTKSKTEFDQYDEGGNKFLAENARPVPPYNSASPKTPLKLDTKTKKMVMGMLGNPPDINIDHLFWLGNLSLLHLGEIAKPVYSAMVKAKHAEIIPLDNRLKILGEK